MSSHISTRKTVYFIRHGESENNAKMKIVIDSFFGLVTLSNFSVLNIATFWASLAQLLMDSDEDSALSDLGVKQASSVQSYAADEFLKMKSDVTDIRIMYSNLQRAKNTANHVLQSHFQEAEEIALLQEATKYEHVFSSSLLSRIDDFEQWLSTVEESTIVIIGHAQYFKHMVKHMSNVHNCDVWKTECTFTTHDGLESQSNTTTTNTSSGSNVSSEDSGSSDGSVGNKNTSSSSNARALVTVKWSDPVLQFRSPFSYQHPMNRFSFLYTDSSADIPASSLSSSTAHTANVNHTEKEKDTVDKNQNKKEGVNENENTDEEDENEVTCRICQMTASESSPGEVFIRPCHCAGTLSHVHINCLNEWRSTSSTAAFKCSVCDYTYRIERTSLSKFLMSDTGVNVITVIILTVAMLSVGVGGIYVSNNVFDIDVCREVCCVAQWRMWWRNCTFTLLTPNLYRYSNYWTMLLFHQDVEEIRAMFWCNWFMVQMTEVVLVGCALLGGSGLMLYMLQECYIFYEDMRRGEMREWKYMAVLGCWIKSLNSTHMGTVTMLLGVSVTCRWLYRTINRVAKKVAQVIGENILEPNH